MQRGGNGGKRKVAPLRRDKLQGSPDDAEVRSPARRRKRPRVVPSPSPRVVGPWTELRESMSGTGAEMVHDIVVALPRMVRAATSGDTANEAGEADDEWPLDDELKQTVTEVTDIRSPAKQRVAVPLLAARPKKRAAGAPRSLEANRC